MAILFVALKIDGHCESESAKGSNQLHCLLTLIIYWKYRLFYLILF
jgi:hypothetical protein